MIDTARVARGNHFRCANTFYKLVLSCLLGFALPAVLCSQAGSQQDMQLSNAQALLQRARDVMGVTEAAGMLVHYHASASLTQNYQSDRMYPPFLDFFQEQESWFNPQTAVERTTVQSSYPLAKPQSSVVLTDAQRAFSLGENGLQVSPRYVMRPRYLNPLLVIADWIDAGGVRAGGIESYRDFPRTVLERQTQEGLQRLFLDPKSGFHPGCRRAQPIRLGGVESCAARRAPPRTHCRGTPEPDSVVQN